MSNSASRTYSTFFLAIGAISFIFPLLLLKTTLFEFDVALVIFLSRLDNGDLRVMEDGHHNSVINDHD